MSAGMIESDPAAGPVGDSVITERGRGQDRVIENDPMMIVVRAGMIIRGRGQDRVIENYHVRQHQQHRFRCKTVTIRTCIGRCRCRHHR